MSYKIFFLVTSALAMNSCSTFHTPISRSLPERDTMSNSANTQTLSTRLNNNIDIQFDWPVDNARLTRGFLPQKRRPHLGIDLASSRGTPILSAQRGTVIYTGRDFHGFGRMVLVESGYGWATLYAHLDKIHVSEGQKISRGEVIGSMGRTGRATGVHLHFEIRKEKGPIDPLPLLPDGQRIARLISSN